VKKTLIFILAICAIATAQDLPRIAVYVTSTMLPHENRVLERSVMSTLLNSGRYKVVDRSAESSSTLEAEHIKQRDGSVNNEQIKKLGTQLGVDFICIPDITKAFGKWSFSVRIINVETAEVVSMGEESFIEMYMDKLKLALDKVLGEMLKTQTAAARSPEAAAAAAPGQIQVKPKYDGTEIYASEHFAAYGGPIAIVGPNNIFTVIYEGKNYYKIRNAKGNDGFVLKKDVVGAGTQFVDTRNKPAEQETAAPVAVDTKIEPAEQATADAGTTMNDWGAGTVSQVREGPKLEAGVVYDYSVGRRFGTWGLNYLIPGLGSLTLMKDYTGTAINAGLVFGGYGLAFLGVAEKSEGIVLTGVLIATSGSIFNIVRSSIYHKPGSIPRPSDFTNGERWGTFGLNYMIPGLGSLAIMKDNTGAAIQIGLAVVGYGLYFSGSAGVVDNGDVSSSDVTLLLSGVGVLMGNFVYNIVRSATYNHTNYRKTVTNPLDGLNLAILPDKNGDLKGYMVYSMEF